MVFINSLPGALALGLIWGILAIGLFISFKVLDIADLTIDGSIVTGAAVFGVCLTNGLPIAVSLLLCFVAGLLCGLITALFNTCLGIPPILSGILTQLILWSANLKILGKANLALNPRNVHLLISSSDNLKTILICLIFVIAIIGLLYWFFGTEFGCSVRSTGNNEVMSRAQGINTNVVKCFGLALSNGFVALSGGLLCQYLGSVDINMGRGAIVIGLASIIIGTSITRLISKNFAFTLLGCVFGSIIYFIIYQFVINLGIDTDLLKMLSAIIVVIFLGLPYLSKLFNKHSGGKKNVKNM